jgi:hypothetical protein
MPYGRKKATSMPRGMATEGTWESAIKRNGPKPTIYPHISGGHHIHGFKSKSDGLGRWHHCERK